MVAKEMGVVWSGVIKVQIPHASSGKIAPVLVKHDELLMLLAQLTNIKDHYCRYVNHTLSSNKTTPTHLLLWLERSLTRYTVTWTPHETSSVSFLNFLARRCSGVSLRAALASSCFLAKTMKQNEVHSFSGVWQLQVALLST